MDFERPRIELIPTQTDKLLDRLSLAGLLFMWVYGFVNYVYLPERIPTHYNLKGEINDYGTKETIFIVPCILTILTIAITILNHYPHIFSYPQNLTKDNAKQQYLLATRMMRYLKLLVVFIAITTTIETVSDAYKGKSGFGMWDMPFFIVLMCAPTGIYIFQSYKLKHRNKTQKA